MTDAARDALAEVGLRPGVRRAAAQARDPAHGREPARAAAARGRRDATATRVVVDAARRRARRPRRARRAGRCVAGRSPKLGLKAVRREVDPLLMWTPRGAWPLIVAVALGAVLFSTPTASARPEGARRAASPRAGVKVDRMPVFTWTPVKGADHYEFQLAADKGFNSTVGERAASSRRRTPPSRSRAR